MRYQDVKPSWRQKTYQAFKFFYRALGRDREMGALFRVEKFSKTLNRLHFNQQGVDESIKKAFFKEQLMGIEFETHAYCNRTCSFCPNSFLDRRNKAEIMPEPIFQRILNDLSAIDFDGQVKMQRYNEPLSHDIIFTRVAQARERLPKANISFHSNGDFVTIDKLKRLDKAGLNEVFVSLYPDYDKHNTKEAIINAGQDLCQKFIKRVGVKAEPVEGNFPLGRYHFWVGKLHITLFAFDLTGGSDRGGALKDMAVDERHSPCESPFVRLYVDWTGDVFPCCNLRADFKEHKDYIMGNVAKSSLMDIYYSSTANFMRKHLATVGPKTGACKTCRFDLMCANKTAKGILDKTMAKLS